MQTPGVDMYIFLLLTTTEDVHKVNRVEKEKEKKDEKREMFLRLRASEKFLDLHLTTGLHDWDMNEEIHLSTTTDQFYQGINIHDIERPVIVQWLGVSFYIY